MGGAFLAFETKHKLLCAWFSVPTPQLGQSGGALEEGGGSGCGLGIGLLGLPW